MRSRSFRSRVRKSPITSPDLPHHLDHLRHVPLSVDRVADQGTGVAEDDLCGFEAELVADAGRGRVAKLVRVPAVLGAPGLELNRLLRS